MVSKKSILTLGFALITSLTFGARVTHTNIAPSNATTATQAESSNPVVSSTVTAAPEPSVAVQKKQHKGFANWLLHKLPGGGGSKSKVVAALLAFFLGTLGIHRFYLGYKKQGFIQLGLTIVGYALIIAGLASFVSSAAGTGTVSFPTTVIIGYVLLVAVGIWAFIDFIRILIGGLQPKDGSYD